jgi:AcrR family transcriptional regulator
MLSAMFDAMEERGVANVTVADVVSRSGVSRRTFYELFEDREDCFLAAFDDALARAEERVVPVFGLSGRWRERVRAALIEMLGFFDDEPGVARLLIVESLAAGPVVLARRARVLEVLAGAMDEGHNAGRVVREVPSLTGEGVVGAVISVIHARLVSGETQPLVELTGPLMGMIVLPYLGLGAAQREILRPVPERIVQVGGGRSDPLRDLPMRLTYRTISVLSAIAANPASSNREVGVAAGMHDQGQISKLLSRLDRLGLVENGGAGSSKGAPNAWTLTAKGREVQSVITR